MSLAHGRGLGALQDRWKETCEALTVPADAERKFWDMIETKYSEQQRFYHTLNHISAMLHEFNEVKSKLSRPDLVAIAIFFHDVVYEPKRKDNEEKSAEMFLEFSSYFERPENAADVQTVREWILATKRHETEVHRTPGMFGTDDIHYFLDMDMSILGVPNKEYEQYAEGIQKEYSHIPAEEFRKRRVKVLRTFLTIPNIYATELFRNRLEAKARENVQNEIERLEQN